MVPLAATTATLTALSGCGGAEQPTPGGCNFPGARRDETGNYKMRNIQCHRPTKSSRPSANPHASHA